MKIINIYTMTESGGAQQRAVKITHELRKRGYDCETWFLFRRFATFDSSPNVKVLFKKEPNKFDYLWIFVLLLLQVIKNKPKVIIAFGRTANPFCLLAAFFCRVPLRVAMQASPSFVYPKVTKLLDRLFGSSKVYSSIISVSQTTLNTFSNYPKGYLRKCIVVNNGIDKPIRNFSNTYRINHRILIGSVGRLAEVKNHRLLIESLKHLPEDYGLTIAGEGPLRGYLESLIDSLGLTKRARLIGEIPSDSVWDFMTSLDIFAFPSLAEAFSLTMVQAALCKKPIVTIDVPTVYGTLGKEACEVSDNTPESFANTLINVNDKKIQIAYDKASQFSFKNMVDGYERIIKGINL